MADDKKDIVILKMTRSETESLLDFIEVAFLDDMRNGGVDNLDYVCNICTIYKQLKQAKQD